MFWWPTSYMLIRSSIFTVRVFSSVRWLLWFLRWTILLIIIEKIKAAEIVCKNFINFLKLAPVALAMHAYQGTQLSWSQWDSASSARLLRSNVGKSATGIRTKKNYLHKFAYFPNIFRLSIFFHNYVMGCTHLPPGSPSRPYWSYHRL